MVDHAFSVVDELGAGSDECGTQEDFDGDVDDRIRHIFSGF